MRPNPCAKAGFLDFGTTTNFLRISHNRRSSTTYRQKLVNHTSVFEVATVYTPSEAAWRSPEVVATQNRVPQHDAREELEGFVRYSHVTA